MPTAPQTDPVSGVAYIRVEQDDQLLAVFGQLNAFTAGRRLRRYQLDIWQTGRFAITTPEGHAHTCDATLYAPVKAFAWRFNGPTGSFWLSSGGPTQAYEINAIHGPGPLLQLAPDADLGTALIFARYLAANPPPEAPAQPCRLIAGHENFAHFMWNELPALLELEAEPCGITSVIASFEPILALTQMLRLPAGVAIQPMAVSHAWAHPVSAHPGVLFAAGANLVTRPAQARVHLLCAAHAGDVTKPPGTRRIWLSLRTLYRTALNELEVFGELIGLLDAHGQRLELLLDGYSLPHDLEFPYRYHAAAQRAQNENVRRCARALIAQAAPKRLRIIDLTGEDLPTAIAWAATADAYICHHGTQQHKIGWLNPVPGMIHANPHILASQPGGWTADQAEGSALPAYVPAALVEDADNPNGRQENPYFRDYRFTDPKAVAAVMFEFLKQEALF
jgi:hypothetical protein